MRISHLLDAGAELVATTTRAFSDGEYRRARATICCARQIDAELRVLAEQAPEREFGKAPGGDEPTCATCHGQREQMWQRLAAMLAKPTVATIVIEQFH